MWAHLNPGPPAFPVRFCCRYICALSSAQKLLKEQDYTLRTHSAVQTWLNKIKIVMKSGTCAGWAGAHFPEFPAGAQWAGWLPLIRG